ncbi:chemotaxis response regulator protein-glutamate methylesterase [Paenibacillus baekrokdamisoli]|uniref:Protein-glutamate methylesterase/protein-glutamine glutaminase n=1 Tax=Paenibacillus baekrokdamisoli TaxID=1712516 RepID=A0A3G9JC29_9BACL|nr:chemotaxis response regulator protein-glutamate methylesterase [Paenibacillus baekrokdamisoli]MBB3069792.1 two-component system chemotaxis response regulator CheB [Paenibacillus baekrokdamisoli]BBH20854.1 chemotaxis response regulator protein-glutamate methylesterase [Paenibacillus baekrokdamisoli]
MNAHRVLVVDDSAFMRKIICDLIAADSQFEIVATAKNGREAIEAVVEWKPDVITMDLEMPVMNGLEALGRIMNIKPTPIIMLSSISDDGTRETIKALQNGAFDFIRKPSGPLSPDIISVGEQLLEKLRIAVLTKRNSQLFKPQEKPSVKQVHQVKQELLLKPLKTLKVDHSGIDKIKDIPSAINKPDPLRGKHLVEDKPVSNKPSNPYPVFEPLNKQEPEGLRTKEKLKQVSNFQHLITIGTSTGGPRALHEVITSLPASLPAPVLVVQHMPPKFTKSLAQRLDAFSSVHVTEAVNGERVYAGMVYIAPGGHHLELAKDSLGYYIRLTEEPPCSGHRPSVDVMFESCTPFTELRRHAVIMTGMGSDGVKGMKALNESGAESAIAEAEESCVVYGMPRSAVEAGAAKSVVPLRQIASVLVKAVMK